MRLSPLLVLAASALCLAAPSPQNAPPDQVRIDAFDVNGSGCRKGTVGAVFSSEKTVLSLSYSEYIASIGPGTKPADHQKNCLVTLNVHYPQGWQFSIFSVDYRGFKQLDKGVTGKQSSIYWFGGTRQDVGQCSCYYITDADTCVGNKIHLYPRPNTPSRGTLYDQ